MSIVNEYISFSNIKKKNLLLKFNVHENNESFLSIMTRVIEIYIVEVEERQ